MVWQCKICQWIASTKGGVLKHYRFHHGSFTHGHFVLCPHSSCPCSFKTQSALNTHLSRYHIHEDNQVPEVLTLNCKSCSTQHCSEKDYFQHLGHHLRSHETIECVFQGCNFKTNRYGTFVTHRSRKHNPHSYRDFKTDVLVMKETESHSFDTKLQDSDTENRCIDGDYQMQDESQTVVNKIALLLLKLESIYNVSSRCIDDLVEELRFVSCLSSHSQLFKNIVESSLSKNNCVLSEENVTEFVNELCKSNPIVRALEAGGPLGSAFKRKQFFKDNFEVVEPVEFVLDAAESRQYHYVPILETLQQVLNSKSMKLDMLKHKVSSDPSHIESFVDGSYFKENRFFDGDELKVSLIIYVDEFEVCNPLGTSKKKHKISAVYWVLANMPPELRSTLTSIHLAILSKGDDVRRFGYDAVLEPLLKDICVLEQEGVFIASVGKTIKGTVLCVVADNLGAHSLSGLVESFTGDYICRFCLGCRSEFQQKEVRSGAFPQRTKEAYAEHVETMKVNPTLTHCFGVKKACPLTEKLTHFHFACGYPPDIAHDLFEGIIPVELALCLSVLIKKKYVTLSELNDSIKHFPYKWTDKTNSPQSIPQNFATRHSVGGNAHENWALIRLLPLFIGSKIPLDEPAWHILMILKDIVELVVSPVHTAESIAFLDLKISEHRHLFLSVFPNERLLPKHHFLEHYPQMIEAFGPLVGFWTMRFESKHSFFKRVVRHTTNFRNVLLSLTTRHQMMMAYHSYASTVTPSVCVSKVHKMPMELVHAEVQEAIRKLSPNQTSVQLANAVSYCGTTYKVGMILPYGCTGGLPDFVEIVQIVLDKGLSFIVKTLIAYYNEHLRSYHLESSGHFLLVEHGALGDSYPLAAYCVGKNRLVTLKRYIGCTF